MEQRIVRHGRPLLLLTLLLLGLRQVGWAQGEAAHGDSASDATEAPPGNTLVPLPAVFYMPETGVGFGAAVSYYYYPTELSRTRNPDRLQPSNLALLAIYTTKKQIILRISGDLYFGGGDFRVLGTVGYSKFPTTFWGVGNDAPDSLEEDYTPNVYELSLELQRQVRPSWYAGVLAHSAYRSLKETVPGGLLATGQVPGTADSRIVGVGVSLVRDTRSNTVFPRSGGYHQARAIVYAGALGSEYDYSSVTVDLRKYVSPVSGHVLALRALGKAVAGTAPFDVLPQLGGDGLLRGYFGGRFRDQDLLAFQAEYRVPVWWRFGTVGFVSAGQVAPRLSSFELNGFKPAAGLGLRILLSPEEGLNIRADYGWGFNVGSSGFYLSIGEAF